MNKFERNCPKCNKILEYKTQTTFNVAENANKCCKSCSRKGYKISEETKNKISKSLTGRIGHKHSEEHKEYISKKLSGRNITWGNKILESKGLKKYELNKEELYRICPNCDDKIEYNNEMNLRRANKNNSFCSKCLPKKRSNDFGLKFKGEKNPMYGKTPTHPKPIYYGDMCLKSSYEMEFVNRLEFLNIKFEYEPKRFKLTKINKTYVPDFYLPEYDLWVEIKGWIKEKDIEKITLIKEEYCVNIVIINNINKIKNFKIEEYGRSKN